MTCLFRVLIVNLRYRRQGEIALVLVGLLSFTVVGIPVALFAFYVVKWAGIAAIFFAIGNRMGRAAGFTPSVLGAVFLVFAAYVVIMLVPTAFGWFGLVLIGTTSAPMPRMSSEKSQASPSSRKPKSMPTKTRKIGNWWMPGTMPTP